MQANEFSDRLDFFIWVPQGNKTFARHLGTHDVVHMKSRAFTFLKAACPRLTDIMK